MKRPAYKPLLAFVDVRTLALDIFQEDPLQRKWGIEQKVNLLTSLYSNGTLRDHIKLSYNEL